VSPVTPGVGLDAPSTAPANALDPPALSDPRTAPGPNDLEFEVDPVAGRARVDTVENTTRYTLENDVRLRYRGYKARADRATFTENPRVVTLEGNVVIESDPLLGTFDYVELDLRTNQFRSRRGQSIVPVSQLGGSIVQPLRVSAELLAREENRRLAGEGGVLTTCDYDDPHYTIAFRRLTVVPGKRVILRNARLRFGNRTVLGLPYLALPITDRPLRYSYLPQFGQNAEEGYFVKFAQGYALRNTLPGLARLDLMSKKGIGVGTDNEYDFGAAAGALSLYLLRDQNRGLNSFAGRINHTQRIDRATSLTVSTDRQQNSYLSLLPDSTTNSSTLGFTRNAGSTSTTLNYNLSASNYGTGTSENASYTLTQSQGLRGIGLGTNGLGHVPFERHALRHARLRLDHARHARTCRAQPAKPRPAICAPSERWAFLIWN
jgi:hypothetical protein